MENIILRGVKENNLKDVSLVIPKNKIVVVTGVSGSGKTSLVFDTIAAAASYQLSQMFPTYLRNRMPHQRMPEAEFIDGLSPVVIIGQSLFTGDVRSTVATLTDLSLPMRLLFSRCAEPRLGSAAEYSFNDPQGMCPACSGLGYQVELDMDCILDCSRSLNEGAILFSGHQPGTYQWQLYAHSGLYDPDKPLKDFTPKEWQDFLHGSGVIVPIRNRTGKVWSDYTLTYEGLYDRLERLYLKQKGASVSKFNQRVLREYTKTGVCRECGGSRLSPAARVSRLLGCNIFEMGDFEIHDLIEKLHTLKAEAGQEVTRYILKILQTIEDMGLGYLTLNRPSRTLSGGELQRLKMVRHLNSSLTGLLYVFDEPSSGLHPKDVGRLSSLLRRLRDRGNSVLVVEHDKDVIRIADEVIDMGPEAGKNGGEVLFQGDVNSLLLADTSTASCLREHVSFKKELREPTGWLRIESARLHNLWDVTVHIPKSVLTVVTGLSGAGKSSLVSGALLKQYPEAEYIGQMQLGSTSRSNLATYIGVMDNIRKLFASENHVSASMFSFNSAGACPACEGKGVIKTEMAFMEPVIVTCEACHGQRYSDEALQYRLRGKNILEVLKLTAEEAVEFFTETNIRSRLKNLVRVGMGYMTLGQPQTTFSRGEYQRIKLAAWLKTRAGIYVMDEPTVGLHPADIRKLMALLDELTDRGNTVILVEHDPDVIRRADWIVDMGPGGGRHGGRVLFSGRPAELMECKESATGAYLREADQRYV